MGAQEESPKLKIERIRVRRGAIDFRVAVALDALYVTEDQATCILELYPNMRNHVCVNGRGEVFGDEIVGTELAHLFEHLIIELQAQAGFTSATGHTSWLEELSETAPRGYALMRTTVTFENDFVALQAAKDACAIIEDFPLNQD